MPRDFIPRPDGDFNLFANHLSDAVHQFWEAHGLDPEPLQDLDKTLNDWNIAYPAQIAAQAQAEMNTQTKKVTRAALDAAIRPLARLIQAMPLTTDADRANMGITVRDTSLTPSPAPETRPLVRITSGQRLQQTIRFNDESTPTRNAKPKGVKGAEVWVAITPANQPPPPLELAEGSTTGPYKFLAVSANGSIKADFTLDKAGQTAHYALRWVSTRWEKGPWSEIASATVAA